MNPNPSDELPPRGFRFRVSKPSEEDKLFEVAGYGALTSKGRETLGVDDELYVDAWELERHGHQLVPIKRRSFPVSWMESADAPNQGTRANRKREGRPCLCGCGEMTKGGRFRPGHDARYYARKRAESGIASDA